MNSSRQEDYGNLSDNELMRLVKKYDQQAMRTLYQRHYGFVTRILQTYCHHPEAIQRTYNDIMMQVWRLAPHFALRSQFKAWLHQVTRGQARRRLAKLAAADSEENDIPGKQRVWRQTNERVQNLPRRQRLFMELFIGTGSIADAAYIMGIKEESARLLYQRAKEQIGTKEDLAKSA